MTASRTARLRTAPSEDRTPTARRPLRRRWGVAALAAVAVISIAGASACGTGQITQTGDQVAAVPGANIDGGPDGTIGLRDLVIAFNAEGYPAGGTAPLVVRIFNSGTTPITLTGATADEAAESVRLVGGAPTATAAPATPTATPTAEAEPTGTASAAPTATATPEAPAPPAGQGTFSIEIPVASYVLLVPGEGPYLQLTGLKKALEPGYVVPMRFLFEGGIEIAVRVPYGLPLTAGPRAEPEDIGHEE